MTSLLTFLFTDLENSTGLWQQAPLTMQDALAGTIDGDGYADCCDNHYSGCYSFS